MNTKEKTLKIKVLDVPVGCILEISAALSEGEITNQIVGGNEDDEVVYLEITYGKEDHKAIGKIEGIIDDFDSDEGKDE